MYKVPAYMLISAGAGLQYSIGFRACSMQHLPTMQLQLRRVADL